MPSHIYCFALLTNPFLSIYLNASHISLGKSDTIYDIDVLWNLTVFPPN